MRFSARICLILFLSLWGLALVGCKGPSEGEVADSNYEALTSSFAIKDKFGMPSETFVVGDEVYFEIKVENTSDAGVTYVATEPSTHIYVYRGDKLIWSPDYDLSHIQIETEKHIAAHSVITESYRWSGTDTSGSSVDIGVYTVTPSLDIPVSPENNTIPESVDITLQ